MKCNYYEYKRITEEMFYGSPQTDAHLNKYTEILQNYLIAGGAGNLMLELNIGIQIVTRKSVLLPEEIITKRFVWLGGSRKGERLDRTEIEAIGMFLRGGALYKKESNYIWN